MTVKGIFWLFILSTDITVGSCIFTLGLIDYLDQHKPGFFFFAHHKKIKLIIKIDKLIICFYYSLVSWAFILLVSFIFRRDIMFSYK